MNASVQDFLFAVVFAGREDISKLMTLQDKGSSAPPPGIYKRKPNPVGLGNKEDDDGMEYLDDEVINPFHKEVHRSR